MSAQCKCPFSTLNPHREEKCAFFRKKSSSPKRAEDATPAGEAIPPVSETKPHHAESVDVPLTVQKDLLSPVDPTTPKSGADQDLDHAQVGKSSEVSKEYLEKLFAGAILSANLPPGTSINVTINVNTPSSASKNNGDETGQNGACKDKYSEPISLDVGPDEDDLETKNDILAGVDIIGVRDYVHIYLLCPYLMVFLLHIHTISTVTCGRRIFC